MVDVGVGALARVGMGPPMLMFPPPRDVVDDIPPTLPVLLVVRTIPEASIAVPERDRVLGMSGRALVSRGLRYESSRLRAPGPVPLVSPRDDGGEISLSLLRPRLRRRARSCVARNFSRRSVHFTSDELAPLDLLGFAEVEDVARREDAEAMVGEVPERTEEEEVADGRVGT